MKKNPPPAEDESEDDIEYVAPAPRRDWAEAVRRIKDHLKRKDARLDLSGLSLRRVPFAIKNFKNLVSLDLSKNGIVLIPEWIGEMTSLQTLILSELQLKGIPESLKKLRRLRRLDLVKVGLTEFPKWLVEISSLHILNVSRNAIAILPEEIGNFGGLRFLSCEDCALNELPKSIRKLNLQEFRVRDNPKLGIPSEVLATYDAGSILDYYLRIEANKDADSSGVGPQPLNEFKLVLVGRGGVGKTSLVHKLVFGTFGQFDRTDGISITEWNVLCGNDNVRANIWDFGGQEIMHGTHRFFITSRSLYLILISAREGMEDYDADYWLSLVRSLAGEVPIIVVLNKCSEMPFELNRRDLRKKYGQEVQFVECEAKADFGIEDLRRLISRMANQMPELRKLFPQEWVTIKNELPKQEKDWMSFESFVEFCAKHGERKRRYCEQLAGYFHDLGLMLSYRHDVALRNFGVLNPHWVTNAIYRIITEPRFRERGGRIRAEDFSQILLADEYPEEIHPYFLALMRKFELCFPLDDRGYAYLVPELLTKEEPFVDDAFDSEAALVFIYRYMNALPQGVLPRFIVQTYVHMKPNLVWRSGVVLVHGEARALVRGDVARRIVRVSVVGPKAHRSMLLKIIRTHFERINDSYENLPVSESVVLPGYGSVEIEYASALAFYQSQIDSFTVFGKMGLRSVPTRALLEEVGMPSTARARSADGFSSVSVGGKALSLFISYSHKDETYCDQLRAALTIYQRTGELEIWDDTRIVPGHKWEPEILKKLIDARIVVLLLSNDFIRSDYCTQVEMKRALRRDLLGKCSIVPIVVRECRYDKLEVGKIQCILPDGKSIKSHRNRDSAWSKVTQGIDAVIEEFNKKRSEN